MESYTCQAQRVTGSIIFINYCEHLWSVSSPDEPEQQPLRISLLPRRPTALWSYATLNESLQLCTAHFSIATEMVTALFSRYMAGATSNCYIIYNVMMPILSLSASSQNEAHVHSYSIPAGDTGHQNHKQHAVLARSCSLSTITNGINKQTHPLSVVACSKHWRH